MIVWGGFSLSCAFSDGVLVHSLGLFSKSEVSGTLWKKKKKKNPTFYSYKRFKSVWMGNICHFYNGTLDQTMWNYLEAFMNYKIYL